MYAVFAPNSRKDLESFGLFEVHSNSTPKTIGIFRFHSHLVSREDEANRLIMHSAFSSGGKEGRFPRAVIKANSQSLHGGKEFCLERNRSRRKGFDVNSFANTKKGGEKRDKMGRRKNF